MPYLSTYCAIRHPWLAFCLAISLLILDSCLYKGNSKRETPEPVAVQEKHRPPPKDSHSPTNLDAEIQKKFLAFSREKEEIYDEILNKLVTLEKKHQALEEKISLLEFLQEENANKTKQSREEIETKIEQLRAQLKEYNALMLNIIQKISTEPQK